MSQYKALVFLVNGVEELEAVAPIDCLRRAGVTVKVASLDLDREVEGRNGIRLCADATLDECLDEAFDLMLVPGGPGHKTLLEDHRVPELLQRQDSGGKLIGSICAGPLVLEKAGLLEGKAYTAHPSTAEKLVRRDPDRGVVRDGNIITSQGAGTATAFGLELVGALCGDEVRSTVAEAICYKG